MRNHWTNISCVSDKVLFFTSECSFLPVFMNKRKHLTVGVSCFFTVAVIFNCNKATSDQCKAAL